MTPNDVLEKILKTYSEGKYYEEVKSAKDEFFTRAGKVAEGSELFEGQMRAFLDWYMFDRPLNGVDLCPVRRWIPRSVDLSRVSPIAFTRFLNI